MEQWKPRVSKVWLHITAGVVWSGVGVLLNSLAYDWLSPLILNKILLIVISGFILAIAIYTFGFSNLADKNIQRIRAYRKEKICIFAFQEWTSYPLVAVMITMGVYLPKYSPIPKPYLASLYIGIGTALFLASIHYYRYLIANQALFHSQEKTG